MVDHHEAVDIGRSILVGVALDQLRLRTRPVVIVLGLFAMAGVVAALLLDDVWRLFAVGVLVLSLVSLIFVVVARFLAGRVLKAIAPPAQVAGHREAVQDAIDQLALPTGPISGLQFAWGLRDGIDDELANANDVITTLRERLDV
ncbi:MAG: hypothetical protein AAGE98_03340 [Actinomycetota bacterium]